LSLVQSMRELADKLAQCSQAGSGAELTPHSVDIALAALRAHADALGPPKIKRTCPQYQIEAMDSQGWPDETLAVVTNGVIAQAAFEEAAKLHPGRKIRLRHGARLIAET
jgi:hypothetical protein